MRQFHPLFASAGLLAIAAAIAASPVRAQIPQPDANGDYRRIPVHPHWEVVDPKNLKQNTALPMRITFVEEMVGITVPDRDTTRSAYGGELRVYDVHIAKMFEVTHYFCDRGRPGGMVWNYRAGGGNINMGTFRVTCAQADAVANQFGLGKSETTSIRYSGEEGYRREETFEIPILNLYGPNISRWLDFTETFTPIR